MAETTVNLIGAGRVGQALLGLLKALPTIDIQDVLSARISSAQEAVQFAGAGRVVEHIKELRSADLWVLTVPDTQISIVASEIAETFARLEFGGSVSVAIHCSGFHSAYELSPLRNIGWHVASAHPMLTFADPKSAIGQFEGTYCGVEGDTQALEIIIPLFQQIGGRPFPINSENKSLYHAAAVFSNNFAVVLQAIAQEAWDAAGVPNEVYQELNRKLLQATYENVSTYGPQDALTGPAARGDQLVVAKQGNDVARWHPEAGNIYNQMSALAQRLKITGSTQEQ